MFTPCYINYISSNILEMIIKEFIRFNDGLYILKRKFQELSVKQDKIQELKSLLGCDIVLRKDGWLLYCEQIAEAEIVNE